MEHLKPRADRPERGECQDSHLRVYVFHRSSGDYYWVGLQDIQGTTGEGDKLRWVRALPGSAASDSSLGCDRCIGKARPFHRCLMSKARPHHRENCQSQSFKMWKNRRHTSDESASGFMRSFRRRSGT